MFGITKIHIIASAMMTLLVTSKLCAQDIQVELPADPLIVEPLRKLMEEVSKDNSRIRSLEAGTGVTSPEEIEVELRLNPDQSSEQVEKLIVDLSVFGITRFRLAGPFENQNMVVIGAPEGTPWIKIHELTVFLTNQRDFKFDIRMRLSDKLPTSTQMSGSDETTSGETAETSLHPINVLYLKHAKAEEVVQKLQQLFPVQGVPIVVDDRTNSLLVRGDKERIRQIEQVIEVLDLENSPMADQSGAVPAENAEAVSQPSTLKVFALQHIAAAEAQRIIVELFGSEVVTISADAQTNSLLVRGDSNAIEEIEATLLKLDESPARSQVSLGRKTPESQITISDTPNGTTAEFRRRLMDLEKPVLELAEQARVTEKSMGKDHPQSLKQRSELRSLVQQTFAARQQIQRAELVEFTRRLERMQQSIDARDQIAEKIVDRRIEELLNPELSWEQVDAERSAPDVLSAVEREADPTTSPDKSVSPALNPDSSAGVTVTVPVSSGQHLIGELQGQIGHDGISLLAEKVPATTPAGTTGLFTINLCHSCRFEAVEVVPESNGQRLAARIFVPQGEVSDAANQKLTQQQIDQLASLGAEFRFDHLRLVDPAADARRKVSQSFQIQLRCENQLSPNSRYASLTEDNHIARFNMAVDEFIRIVTRVGERVTTFQLSFEPNSRSELAQSWMEHNALPVEFSVEDQKRIAAGEFMIKVIYLDSENGQTRTITAHKFDSGVNPVAEARQKGTLLGVIRISR
ncbi:MAG: hypothetical protein JNL58_14450 [Planctomyces sp.]|nr:hypothetical protein [Planctomyces sp.]